MLLALAGTLALYGWRWRAARAQDGPRAAPASRLLAATTGVALVFAALISPVDRLAEQLLVMHMTQHLLLLDLAPIFLLVGLTRVLMRPVTRRLLAVEGAIGPLAHPAFAAVLYCATMGTWHVPALYDAALAHHVVHVAEHASLVTAGTLYWWHLLSPVRGRHALTGLGPVVYMISTKLAVGLLGIALTFSGASLYDHYAEGARYWGLSALEDQNVAGALMAFEQTIVMGIALLFLFIRALGESERQEQRAERYADVSGTP